MVGTFKGNIPYNNFLLLLYGLALKLPMFVLPVKPVVGEADAVFYRLTMKWLQPIGNNFPVVYSIIAFIFLYFQAVAFNKIVNNQRLMPRPNYLAGMSYLLITSAVTGWYGLNEQIIVMSFFISIVSGLCNLHNNPEPKSTLFNIGLFTGLATLFYFPSIVFLLLVLTGIAITRTFKPGEWIIAFIGMLAPYYFLWAIVYLLGNNSLNITPTFALSMPGWPQQGIEVASLILIMVTAIIGFIFTQNNMRRLLVQSRKSWGILYIFLVIAVIVPFLNARPAINYWMLTTLPLSALCAAAFLYPDRKWFSQLMHWAIVLLCFVVAGLRLSEKLGR